MAKWSPSAARPGAFVAAVGCAAILLAPGATEAQTGDGAGSPSTQTGATQPAEDDDDFYVSVTQPDFTVIALPTTLRLPRFKSAFRDLFGLDSGAQIGLEYRFGLMRGLQAGIHRTSNKTIAFFGQYTALRQQPGGSPVGLGVLASVDGANNFRDVYAPAFGVVLSRTVGTTAAVYVEPIWVHNSHPAPVSILDRHDTVVVGLAARLRMRPTVYLLGEAAPRVAGFGPGVMHGSVGIEKRAGGHTFQLNVSNGFGTTMGQIARGGFASDDWYLGFNISRKFF